MEAAGGNSHLQGVPVGFWEDEDEQVEGLQALPQVGDVWGKRADWVSGLPGRLRDAPALSLEARPWGGEIPGNPPLRGWEMVPGFVAAQTEPQPVLVVRLTLYTV